MWLNGRPLRADLEAALGRPVRLANDANCFALSEASDGAAAGAGVVFGVIAGTGVGGGVVVDGKVLGGAHGVGGEWGHIPLPAMTDGGTRRQPRLLLRQARLPGDLVQRAVPGTRVRAADRTHADAAEIAASDGADERAADRRGWSTGWRAPWRRWSTSWTRM